MFVLSSLRKGIANKILNEIESWAIEQGFTNFILETSPKLKAAIGHCINGNGVPIYS